MTNPTQPPDETSPGSAQPWNIETLTDWGVRFVTAWNSHEPDRLASLATDDVTWEDPFIYPHGTLHGTEELRRWLRSLWVALPDFEFQPRSAFLSIDGSQICALWTARGRMTGPLDPPGFAPTGRIVETTGIDIHSFRDGLLAHVLTVTDVNAMARQIGAAPAAGSFSERLGVRFQRLAARRMRKRSNE